MMLLFVLLAVEVVCSAIGTAIGDHKNMAELGFGLGLFFGVIGLAIIAAISVEPVDGAALEEAWSGLDEAWVRY